MEYNPRAATTARNRKTLTDYIGELDATLEAISENCAPMYSCILIRTMRKNLVKITPPIQHAHNFGSIVLHSIENDMRARNDRP